MQRFDKVINKVCKDLKMIKLEYEKRPEGCKDIKIGKFEYERTDLLQLQGSKHVEKIIYVVFSRLFKVFSCVIIQIINVFIK